MKIIGNREVFAFEYTLLNKVDKYIFANLCFWIKGERIGDYEIECTISISLSFLEDFLEQYEHREYYKSYRLKKEVIFFELYDKFFQNSIKGFQESNMGKYQEYFWLDDVGDEAFRDKIGIILLNEPSVNRQRLIWKVFNTNTVNEAYIPMNYFDQHAKDFINHIRNDMQENFT